MNIGDMMIAPGAPLPLVKALAVVERQLHDLFWRCGLDSKRSCILSSLTVRDYLFRVGFHDAQVMPVFYFIEAHRPDGEVAHSLGIGHPDGKPYDLTATGWDGHMVVLLPRLGWLIDTTLFQAIRPAWPDLTGIQAVPIDPDLPRVDGDSPWAGMQPLACMFATSDNGNKLFQCWHAQPSNKRWRTAPDAGKRRREFVVDTMVAFYKAHVRDDPDVAVSRCA